LTPLPLLKQNGEWHTPESLRKETAQHSQHALELKHIMFFSRNGLVLDHPRPNGTTVNGYYCSLFQDRQGWLFTVNNQK
jgi:hypothetical protein